MYNMHPDFERGSYGQSCACYALELMGIYFSILPEKFLYGVLDAVGYKLTIFLSFSKFLMFGCHFSVVTCVCCHSIAEPSTV